MVYMFKKLLTVLLCCCPSEREQGSLGTVGTMVIRLLLPKGLFGKKFWNEESINVTEAFFMVTAEWKQHKH